MYFLVQANWKLHLPIDRYYAMGGGRLDSHFYIYKENYLLFLITDIFLNSYIENYWVLKELSPSPTSKWKPVKSYGEINKSKPH